MAGKKTEYKEVPYFWTEQAGMSLRYVGYVRSWDEIIIDGNLAHKNFVAYYIKNNTVFAAAGINRNKEMDAIHLLIKEQNLPEVEALRDNSADVLALVKT